MLITDSISENLTDSDLESIKLENENKTTLRKLECQPKHLEGEADYI